MNQHHACRHTVNPDFILEFPITEVVIASTPVHHRFRWHRSGEIQPTHYWYVALVHIVSEANERIRWRHSIVFNEKQPFKAALDAGFNCKVLGISDLVSQWDIAILVLHHICF